MLLWHLRADTIWMSEFTRDSLSCKHHSLDKELIMLRHGKFCQNNSKLFKKVKSPCLVATLTASTRLQFFLSNIGAGRLQYQKGRMKLLGSIFQSGCYLVNPCLLILVRISAIVFNSRWHLWLLWNWQYGLVVSIM